MFEGIEHQLSLPVKVGSQAGSRLPIRLARGRFNILQRLAECLGPEIGRAASQPVGDMHDLGGGALLQQGLQFSQSRGQFGAC